jgi:hypothetical protein
MGCTVKLTAKDLEAYCSEHCTNELGWSKTKRARCRQRHACEEMRKMRAGDAKGDGYVYLVWYWSGWLFDDQWKLLDICATKAIADSVKEHHKNTLSSARVGFGKWRQEKRKIKTAAPAKGK